MDGSLCAFLDASALYPVSLRHLLMRLTFERLYPARGSAAVHVEWIRAVLRDHPQDSVVTGTETLIGSSTLPEPHDRHVLAAAIVGRADIIVTHNLPGGAQAARVATARLLATDIVRPPNGVYSDDSIKDFRT